MKGKQIPRVIGAQEGKTVNEWGFVIHTIFIHKNVFTAIKDDTLYNLYFLAYSL